MVTTVAKRRLALMANWDWGKALTYSYYLCAAVWVMKVFSNFTYIFFNWCACCVLHAACRTRPPPSVLFPPLSHRTPSPTTPPPTARERQTRRTALLSRRCGSPLPPPPIPSQRRSPVSHRRLTTILRDLDFGLVTVIFIVIGLLMFLIPVVPGPAVYLTAGVLMVPLGKQKFGSGAGFDPCREAEVGSGGEGGPPEDNDLTAFGLSCAYACTLSFALKLIAHVLQQKAIGETFSSRVAVRAMVGPNTQQVRRVLAPPTPHPHPLPFASLPGAPSAVPVGGHPPPHLTLPVAPSLLRCRCARRGTSSRSAASRSPRRACCAAGPTGRRRSSAACSSSTAARCSSGW